MVEATDPDQYEFLDTDDFVVSSSGGSCNLYFETNISGKRNLVWDNPIGEQICEVTITVTDDENASAVQNVYAQ